MLTIFLVGFVLSMMHLTITSLTDEYHGCAGNWSTNALAIVGWSLFWPVSIPILLIGLIYQRNS